MLKNRKRASSSPELRERASSCWRDEAVGAFLDRYMPIAEAAGVLPHDAELRGGLLDLFLIQKACYELGYEAAHRPTWISIPLRGLLDLISVRGPQP
jgi:maltose alpha-D-glucosyltransferase/alpha-amylase